MTYSANKTTTASYYSLVAADGAVLLVTKWMEDYPTNATCWAEIDREAHRIGEEANCAYDRLKARAKHLLPIASSTP